MKAERLMHSMSVQEVVQVATSTVVLKTDGIDMG